MPRQHRVIAEKPPEVLAIEASAAELVRQTNVSALELAVSTIEITDEQNLRVANTYLVAIKDGRAKVLEYWDPKCSAANLTHKLLTSARAAQLKRFDVAIDRLSELMREFIEERDRQVADTQKQLDHQVNQLKRIKGKEAATLERRGEFEAAEGIRKQLDNLVAPIVPREPIKLEGTAIRGHWEGTIDDPTKVVQGIIDGIIPIDIIKEWNMTLIGKMAAESGGLKWPGITVKETKTFARSGQ